MLGTLACLTLAGMLVVWGIESRQREAERAEGREANEASMRQAMARAQVCIDGIAAHDPRKDAERDLERGDPTPIGITQTPQESDPFTIYPEVEGCPVLASSYEPTGKPFTYTEFGSPFRPPPNYRACEAAAQRYASAYNRRMVEIAPQAVSRFCRRIVAAHLQRVRPGPSRLRR